MNTPKFLDKLKQTVTGATDEDVDVLAADPTIGADTPAAEPEEEVAREDGVTLLRVPEHNRQAYITARRVPTYGEIVQIDAEGVARCHTVPAVTALLHRGFKRIHAEDA